jgi:HAD superfamily hydrolase (TIGR01509 family)
VSGLVFDCDGTLLDTMPAWNEEEARMTELTGVPWTQEMYEEIRAVPLNEGARIYHERYGVGESPEAVLQLIDGMLIDFYRDKSVALPGARELLERARSLGIPCVVVTSSPQRYVVPGLRRAGLDGYFRRIITTDDVGLSKQDPRIWQIALRELGAQPETSWGLDDSVYAVKVMNQVGMNTVGAYDCDETGTFEDLAAVADIAVHSLEELL